MLLSDHIIIPRHLWEGVYATGSRVICNPPVVDTDKDFVIYTSTPSELINYLVDNGFEISINESYKFDPNTGITCLRKLDVNLVVTSDYNFYLKFIDATKLAKKLNLLEKSKRIELFQYVLYGNI